MSDVTEVEVEYKPVNKIYKLFSWLGCYIYPRTIMKRNKNYVILLKEDGEEYKDKINKFINRVALNCLFFLVFLFFFIIIIIVYI